MSFVAVDVGNSKTHFAVYDAIAADGWPTPRHHFSLTNDLLATLQVSPLAELLAAEHRWCVITVNRKAEARLSACVAERANGDYRLFKSEEIPIADNVRQRSRVGVDRLAAAFAANQLREASRPAIVVDAGTAVTVDVVDDGGIFQGGVILPGMAMTAHALSTDTDALPLIEFEQGAEPPQVVGKSTEEAIRAGLFWGVVGAVREIVARAGADFSTPPQIFVTGGDAERMTPLLGEGARFIPDLVVGGIALTAAAISERAL